ncbi:sulfite exporter TauE/SafE family protein [Halalkalibacter okhensis]|uniref:Probable membrane transporter protein n=1 Tax=Halalkalibacter okhensis TaxID=333138 RepID=A0A0B0ILB9_9BACI|nr:sulfite exporter TauE/SafE family protein [Halalkalibacter okhensis]KHF41692.1 hypothetical protein LQ50_03045 [Halalkalibacter okhensis]
MHTHDETQKQIFLKVSLIGLFGGFFGGLLGIGGSFLVIPFLIASLGLSPHKSHATALPVAFASGVAALGFYFSSGQIDVSISIQVMIGCLVGVIAGTRLMKFVKGQMLSFLFGLFLLSLASVYMFPVTPLSSIVTTSQYYTIVMAIGLGLVAGLSSGLFGAGGGTILVPGTVILLQVSEHMGQGISLLAIIPTTILGTWLQYKQDNIALNIAPLLTGTAFIGGLLGGYMAILTHGTILRALIVIALLYIGLQNAIKNYPWRKKAASSQISKVN